MGSERDNFVPAIHQRQAFVNVRKGVFVKRDVKLLNYSEKRGTVKVATGVT
jgi:hypothetical protein